MKTNVHFLIISQSFVLRMGTVTDKFVEKIITHIVYFITFPKIFSFYEILWKNIVLPYRIQMRL